MHTEYWEESEQHRYEDRMALELQGIRREIRSGKDEVKRLSDRITLLMGAVGIVAFLIPIVAPFVRAIFNIGP